MAVACRLPECAELVRRPHGGGQRPWFCSSMHRVEFFRRGRALSAAIGALEKESEAEMGTRARRRLAADLRWLLELQAKQYPL